MYIHVVLLCTIVRNKALIRLTMYLSSKEFIFCKRNVYGHSLLGELSHISHLFHEFDPMTSELLIFQPFDIHLYSITYFALRL